jgi:hypothetical protein
MDNNLAMKIASCMNRRCLNSGKKGYGMWNSVHIQNIHINNVCYYESVCSNCSEIIQILNELEHDDSNNSNSSDYILLEMMIPLVKVIKYKEHLFKLAQILADQE